MRSAKILLLSLVGATCVDARSQASARALVRRPAFLVIPRGGQYDDDRWNNNGSNGGGGYYPDDDRSYSSGRPKDDYYGDDQDYFDDRGMGRRDSGGSNIMSDLPQMIKTGNRKIGLPMLGVGAALTLMGISLFFNKTLMRLGNLCFVAGVPMSIGAGRTAGYFLQPKKVRATGCLAFGIFLVFVGWPMFGIILEAFGVLNLFGNMFPVAMAILKTLPVIGPLLRGTDSASSRRRNDSDKYSGDDDDDYYGGGDGGYYDDGGRGNDDYNRGYY